MIRIYICDDDAVFLEQSKKRISDCITNSRFDDFEYEIRSFNNPHLLLKKYAEEKPEIIFLDIDMPEINGFNIANEINEQGGETLIIFSTNYDNYVYTSFRYRPFRFIRKSHIDTELPEALQSALNELLCNNKVLELGGKYFNEKIFISDIIYFESKRNYAEIVCTDGKRYLYRSTLSDLERRFKCFDFLRIHAGYLINMKHIDKVHQNIITLCNGEQLNISKRLYAQVCSAYSEYLRR